MSNKIDPYQQGWDAVDKIPPYKHPVSEMGLFPTNPFPRHASCQSQRDLWTEGFRAHLDARVSEMFAKKNDEGIQ